MDTGIELSVVNSAKDGTEGENIVLEHLVPFLVKQLNSFGPGRASGFAQAKTTDEAYDKIRQGHKLEDELDQQWNES